MWVTANGVLGGAEFAFPAQALSAIIDSRVTLPAARSRRLVTAIAPIPLADSNIRLADCHAATTRVHFRAASSNFGQQLPIRDWPDAIVS